MKILIPIIFFGKEGGYKVLSKLASEFVRKGHVVDFIVPYLSPEPYHLTTGNIIWLDRQGNWCTTRPESTDICSIWRSMYILWLGLRKESFVKYDIILANHSLSTFPTYFSKISGIKYYYIQAYEPEHYHEIPGFKSRVLEWLSKKSYLLPFKKIVNSSIYFNYKEIKAFDFVPPGIDFKSYYKKDNPAVFKNPIRIGTIARREPHKGTGVVLAAFNAIFGKRKDVELHLAFGDKSLENKEKNIFVCSPNGDKMLSEFYRSLDIYVCAVTTQHGAIHYPVLETMASGTTLITTDYYPATCNNSFMVEPSNSDSIVYAFEMLIIDQQKRLDKINEALKDVQQFDWDKVSEKMLSIFRASL